MEIRIAIVDDLKEDRERLEKMVNVWAIHQKHTIRELKTYPRGEALLQEYQPGMFSLVFMDIVMDELNGIETATRIREIDTDVLIVFQTTSREYAFDAFPVHPFDYLIKPCEQEQLEQVMREAIRVLNAGAVTVTIRTPRNTLDVPLQKINAVLSHGHIVEVILTDGTSIESRMTFREVETTLQQYPQFLTCNRGVIVNMDHVDSMKNGTAKMKSGDSYALRVRGQNEIISRFSQYMISRMRTHLGD